jgi:perosamine synthetase
MTDAYVKVQIPSARSAISERDKGAVLEVFEASTLALGPKLRAVEQKAAECVGYGIATNRGKSVLHLIIRALGIGEGDEVITTPFSFISSANCILFARGTGLRRHRSGDTVHRFRRN